MQTIGIISLIIILIVGGYAFYVESIKADFWVSQGSETFYATRIISQTETSITFMDAWTDNPTTITGIFAVQDWHHNHEQ